MSWKRDEKVSGGDTGRSGGTNPRRRKPTGSVPRVWDRPVCHSVMRTSGTRWKMRYCGFSALHRKGEAEGKIRRVIYRHRNEYPVSVIL